jgi:putative resolvase
MATLQSTACASGRLVCIGEAARLANVNPQTIRRYLESGLIEGKTTPGGHRRINLASVADAFGVAYATEELGEENTGRMVVLFARVSTNKQANAGDLNRQVEALREYASRHYPGMPVKVLAGVGSGLSDTRPEFLKLIDLIVAGRVATVLCSYRDRIARFGVNVVAHLCKANGTELVEIKTGDDEDRAATLEEEAVKDCMAVLHCFSNRLMGKRGGAKTKVIPPEGMREKICALRGAGLSRRAILAEIAKDKPVCLNTGRQIGDWYVRRTLDELGSEAPVVPKSVKTFLRSRCSVGPAKRVESNDLYAAYATHAESQRAKPLTRDKFAHFIKTSVPTARFENGAGGCPGMAYGLTLKATA